MINRRLKETQANIKLVNTVVSTRINETVDIEKLAITMPGTQYDPESFPGLVMRRPDIKATLVLFSTGRYVSMSPTKQSAVKALIVIAKEISKIEKHRVSMEEYRVENMVATMNYNVTINVEKLSENVDCVYEPEQFPAVICRPGKSVVLLVFRSGKVNCVGAKSKSEIVSAFEWLKDLIEKLGL